MSDEPLEQDPAASVDRSASPLSTSPDDPDAV